MEVVTIGSMAYDSYASVADADEYLAAALHAGSDWDDSSDATKGMALVTMTRILDRQRWLADYDTQAERAAVTAIQQACIEGALALVQGADFQTEVSTAQKLQSIRAGSVAMTYFRGAEGAPRRFPAIVDELLRAYLSGASLANYGSSNGVGGTPLSDSDFGHTESI